MKKMIIITLIIISDIVTLTSGNLSFGNDKAESGEVLSMTYEPDGRYFLGEDLWALVYAFDEKNQMPAAYEFKLNYHEKMIYSGSFTVPSDKFYIMIKISNGEIVDDNRGDFWDYFLIKNGKYFKGSNLKAGLTYLGSMPENLFRNIDFNKALAYLKAETDNFPDNIQGKIAYTSLLLDLQSIDFQTYSDKMGKILKMNYDENDENDVRAVSRALKTLNKSAESEIIEKKFSGMFPKSQLAEEFELSDLSKAENLDSFSSGIINYLSWFPATENRERIFSALVSGYLQVGKYEDLLKILNEKENTPAGAYAQIAFSLMNDSVFQNIEPETRAQIAIDLMNKSVIYIKKENIQFKPIYISTNEWSIRNRIRYAGLMEQYGQILMSLSEFEEAYIKFAEALEVYKENAPIGLYENVIELCIKLEQTKIAYNTALLAIKNSHYSDNIIEDFKKFHSDLYKPESIEPYTIKLLNDAKMSRLNKLAYQNLNKNLSSISLKNSDDIAFGINDISGKVCIFTFWSSWCDPCDEALDGLDSLAILYKDSSNVSCSSVNIWETESERINLVKKYFTDSEPNFKMLIDENNTLAKDLGISGLPFTCFIGKDGKIQFIDKGYTNLDDFLFNSKDKIDFLLNN